MFELDETLIDHILFYMEDQDGEFLYDSDEGEIITLEEITFEGGDPNDEERYFGLPAWTSSDGFLLMGKFAAGVRNPLTREKLLGVLDSGKKVFRNFKDTLAEYPQIEAAWFAFKDKEMKRVVRDWYNTLRERWGLEALKDEPEESEDLVYGDFVIRQFVAERDSAAKEAANDAFCKELETGYTGDLGLAAAALWRDAESGEEKEGATGLALTAETAGGDFAGYISATSCLPLARYAVVVRSFLVKRDYRGLGIGKELLNCLLTRLLEKEVRWVLLANPVISETLIPFLVRSGFEKLGSCFFIDLCKSQSND